MGYLVRLTSTVCDNDEVVGALASPVRIKVDIV